MTLGGNVCIRDGNKLDYCWRECISSLLPVCDEVVVCDGGSTDGTQEEIRAWINREPKLKLCVYHWPNPTGDIEFWVNWMNYARQHVTSDFQIQLDADEILSEQSYDHIRVFKGRSGKTRMALWCDRYNFWSDAKHVIPHGVCCSHRVARIAPQNVWLPSDGPNPKGHEAISMAVLSPVAIFHYGFIRKPDAFFRKAKALQDYFFGNYDYRLADAERQLIQDGGNWMRDIKDVEWVNRLVPFDGPHPAIAIPWLKERGYA